MELIARTTGTEAETKGKWRLKICNLRQKEILEEYFDAVMICNGHYFEPSLPSLKGHDIFNGQQLHSHDYRLSEPFADKRVVVVGAGPSGIFIIFLHSTVSNFPPILFFVGAQI